MFIVIFACSSSNSDDFHRQKRKEHAKAKRQEVQKKTKGKRFEENYRKEMLEEFCRLSAKSAKQEYVFENPLTTWEDKNGRDPTTLEENYQNCLEAYNQSLYNERRNPGLAGKNSQYFYKQVECLSSNENLQHITTSESSYRDFYNVIVRCRNQYRSRSNFEYMELP